MDQFRNADKNKIKPHNFVLYSYHHNNLSNIIYIVFMYHMSQETRLFWVVPTKERSRKVLCI